MQQPNLSRIQDEPTRAVIEVIQANFNSSDLLNGNFKFFEINIPGAVTKQEIFHNLRFVPKDIITTRTSGTYTWLYDQFTNKQLYITTTTAVSIRCLVGRL